MKRFNSSCTYRQQLLRVLDADTSGSETAFCNQQGTGPSLSCNALQFVTCLGPLLPQAHSTKWPLDTSLRQCLTAVTDIISPKITTG